MEAGSLSVNVLARKIQMASPFLQFPKIENLAITGGYSQNTALSQQSAVFLLSACNYLRDKWIWQSPSIPIDENEYNSILDMIALAEFELMRNVMIGQIIQTVCEMELTDGFALMDGQLLLATEYPELADCVPVSWIVGLDIVLPDMQSTGTFGTTNSGQVGTLVGSNAVTLVTAQMPSHTHIQVPHSHTTVIPLVTPVGAVPVPPTPNVVIGTPSSTLPATATNNPTGGGESHDNIQESLQIYNYIVIR